MKKNLLFNCLLGAFLLFGLLIQSHATKKEYTIADVTAFNTDIGTSTYDTLVLAEAGVYTVTGNKTPPNSKTIMAKSGLATKPILNYSSSGSGSTDGYFRPTAAGVNITLIGLEIDGRNQGTGTAKPSIVYLQSGVTGGKLTVRDCYIHHVANTNGAFNLRGSGNIVDISNSKFDYCSARIIHLYTETVTYGDINIKNSSFSHSTSTSSAGVIFFRSSGGSKAKGTNATIENCVFLKTSADVFSFGEMSGQIIIKNCIFDKVAGKISTTGSVPLTLDSCYLAGFPNQPNGTNVFTVEPQYVDSANLNFTLANSAAYYASRVPAPPTITSPTKTSITDVSAIIGANITNNGGGSITSRGTTLSKSSRTPVDSVLLDSNNSDGIFTLTRTDLTASTKYYFRAFARNGAGISYTDVDSFTTLAPSGPVVTAAVQSATNAAGKTVVVQSSVATGKVYIIKDGVTQATVADLDAAVVAKDGAVANVTAANTDIPISTEGLNAGTYYAYAVDGTGNISVKGANAITITVPKTISTLSDIQVNGTSIAGFSSGTTTYNIEMPFGSATPTIAYTKSDADASVVQTVNFPGATSLEVTAQDGTTKTTYTINFTITPGKTIATLSDIQVNGATVTGFSSATTTYNIQLPFGSALPTVTYTKSDADATVAQTDVTALPGTTTLLVTAQDGTTKITYTLNFTVPTLDPNADLSSLLYNYASVPNFNANTTSYTVQLPSSTIFVPVVTYTTSSTLATAQKTDATAIPGTTTVVVTAQSGATKTYSITFQYTAPAGIDDINADEVSFSPVPVTSVLKVEVPESLVKGQIFVYNLNGGLQLKKAIDKTSVEVDFSSLPGGIYHVKMVSKGGATFVQKIVKQ